MDEDAIKLEVGLHCAEWLSCAMTATLLRLAGDPAELLVGTRAQVLAACPREDICGGPAMSDYLSAELEAGVDGLLEMVGSSLAKT